MTVPAAGRADMLQQAAALLRAAKRAVVFTGAGISTPSGIPDYRSAGSGLWTRSNPMDVSSLSAFRRRPEQFYAWLHPLAAKILSAQPNPAHLALADLQKAGVLKAVITQNIDGLHQRAGSPNVIELHGSLETFTCPQCKKSYPGTTFWAPFVDEKIIPRCPIDHQNLKPDIILFEEMLPRRAWQAAEDYSTAADVMIVAGSSLAVSPANSLPYAAARGGAALIINTLSETYLDDQASVRLPYDVAEILPAIARLVLD